LKVVENALRDTSFLRLFVDEALRKNLSDDQLIELFSQSTEFSENELRGYLIGDDGWEGNDHKLTRFIRLRYGIDVADMGDFYKRKLWSTDNPYEMFVALKYRNSLTRFIGSRMTLHLHKMNENSRLANDEHIASHYYDYRRDIDAGLDQKEVVSQLELFFSNEAMPTRIADDLARYFMSEWEIATSVIDTDREGPEWHKKGYMKSDKSVIPYIDLELPLANLIDSIDTQIAVLQSSLPNEPNSLPEIRSTISAIQGIKDCLLSLEQEIDASGDSADGHVSTIKFDLYSRVEELCQSLVGRDRASPMIDAAFIGGCFSFLSLCGMPPVFAASTAIGSFAGPKLYEKISKLQKKG
jgi:hypothetical protein